MTTPSLIPSYRSLKDSGLTLTTIFTSLISEHRSRSKTKDPSPFSMRHSKGPLQSSRQSDNQKRAIDMRIISELKVLETQISRLKTNTEERTMNSKERTSLDTLFNDEEKDEYLCPLVPEPKPRKKLRMNTKSKHSIFIDENRKSESIKKLARVANSRKPVPSKHISLKKLSDSIMTGRPPLFVHLRTSKDKSQLSNPMKSLALSNVSISKPEISHQIKSFDQRIHFFSHRPQNINEARKKSEKSREDRRLEKSIKNASGHNISLKGCMQHLSKDQLKHKKVESKSFKAKRFSLMQFTKAIPSIVTLIKHAEPSENVNRTNIQGSKDNEVKKPMLIRDKGFLGSLNKSSIDNHSSVFRVIPQIKLRSKEGEKAHDSGPKKISLKKPIAKTNDLSEKKPLILRNIVQGKNGPTFHNYFKDINNNKKSANRKANRIENAESEVSRLITPKSITDFIKLSKLKRTDFKELDELKNSSSTIFEFTRKDSTNRNSTDKSLLDSKDAKDKLGATGQKPQSDKKGSFRFIPISLDSLTQLPREPSSKQLTASKPLGRNSSTKDFGKKTNSIRDLGMIDLAIIEQPLTIIKAISADLQLISAALENESFLRHYSSTDLPLEMKSTVVDWLFQLTAELQISRQTLYIGLHILARYLSESRLDPDSLQFDALTALTLAIKFEEVHYLSVDQLVKSMEDTYTTQQLIDNERRMYRAIEYQIPNHTILCLLHSVQLSWDSDENSDLSLRLPKDPQYPKFLEKSEESYNLYRISMNKLDYLMMTRESFRSIDNIIAAILVASLQIYYQSAILKDANLNEIIVKVAVDFTRSLLSQNNSKACVISDSLTARLRRLPNVLEIPGSESHSTYHEYLFAQVHNPALLEYVDSLL